MGARRWRGIAASLCLSIGAGLLGACGAMRPLPVVLPEPAPSLTSGEGFLIVQIDTDTRLIDVHAGSSMIARELSPGQHIWIVRMPAGEYAWTRVRTISRNGTISLRPRSVGVLHEREFEFDVVAGHINYAGELVVRTGPVESHVTRNRILVRQQFSIRNRNHSAMAVRRLARTHAAMLDAHPIRYAGRSGDGFLDFFTRERTRLSVRRAGEDG